MPEQRIVVIRNPASGRGRRKHAWQPIESALLAAGAEILVTERPGHARELAARAEPGDLVVAAGGDGTLNEVVNGLMGRGATLGLIPLGTGNDFARTLEVTLANAVGVLLNGVERAVDVGRWQCGGRSGRFVNVAGCGFDAAVAERINHGFRYLNGTSAYVASVLQTLGRYTPTEMRICVDGEQHSIRAMLCAVANATCYGGGMRIAPHADLCDGQLDLVIVGEVGRFEFMRSFPRVFRGEHLSHPRVTCLSGHTISIESETPIPVLADGELVGSTPAEFTIEAGALRVRAPRV